jgi:hypothetical protein
MGMMQQLIPVEKSSIHSAVIVGDPSTKVQPRVGYNKGRRNSTTSVTNSDIVAPTDVSTIKMRNALQLAFKDF